MIEDLKITQYGLNSILMGKQIFCWEMKHFFIVFIPVCDILLLIVSVKGGGGSIPQESLFGITYYEIQISTFGGSQNTSIQCGTKINTSIQCGTKLD